MFSINNTRHSTANMSEINFNTSKGVKVHNLQTMYHADSYQLSLKTIYI